MFLINRDDQSLICSDRHYVHVPLRLRDLATFLYPKHAYGAGEWSPLNFE